MASPYAPKSFAAIALGVTFAVASAQEPGRTLTPVDLQWKPSTRVKGLEQADLIGCAFH